MNNKETIELKYKLIIKGQEIELTQAEIELLKQQLGVTSSFNTWTTKYYPRKSDMEEHKTRWWTC